MCFHVLVKILFHVEVFAAPLAHELLVADVDAHVGAQLVLVLEPLVTVLRQGRETISERKTHSDKRADTHKTKQSKHLSHALSLSTT